MANMQNVEKGIVRKLIKELGKAGFVPKCVWDGCEYVDTPDADSAIDAIWAVDDFPTLHFADANGHWGNLGVMLVTGNGFDIVSDYHYHDKGGHKAFSDCLDKFCDTISDLEVEFR